MRLSFQSIRIRVKRRKIGDVDYPAMAVVIDETGLSIIETAEKSMRPQPAMMTPNGSRVTYCSGWS